MTSTLPDIDRSIAAVTQRQLRAMEAFHDARHAAERAAALAAQSREARMDAARRMEVLRRQHAAVVERTEQAIRESGALLRTTRTTTAVVAHRQEWFTRKVEHALEQRGVSVLAHTAVGADAVGYALAEQPDLVIVDDTLAMLSGEDVVREVRHYCPTAVIGAQVAYSDRLAQMLDAGASAVYVRAVPPELLVEELLGLVPA